MSNKKKAFSVFAFFFISVVFGGFFLFKYNFIEIKKEAEKQADPVFKSADSATTALKNSPPAPITSQDVFERLEITEEEKIKKEAVRKRADNVKGVYINGYSASFENSAVRQNIKNLLVTTELNSIVIDVKEAEGPYMPGSMKKFIDDLHKDNIWVIARICVFRDSSLIEKNPEWYLKYNATTSATTSELWKDSGGGYWLDPASPDVQNYIINFSKKVIDFGFDELQFDYIRFPSDGDLGTIIYPFYDREKEKSEVMKGFFSNLSESLKNYRYSVVLSVDFFGYVATQYRALTIGQRISDIIDKFDFVSFMLYPSHFYGGFSVPKDSERGLPAVYFPYNATDTDSVSSSHPYEVILRSIFKALDFLNNASSTTKIRPWLQDFNLKLDTDRGIYYDAAKVRSQIQAAEDAGASGWLLWNPSNVYTKDALMPE
ncbi:MAG: putative glycoside hydrolase [Parcubacteria group bacterium]